MASLFCQEDIDSLAWRGAQIAEGFEDDSFWRDGFLDEIVAHGESAREGESLRCPRGLVSDGGEGIDRDEGDFAVFDLFKQTVECCLAASREVFGLALE